MTRGENLRAPMPIDESRVLRPAVCPKQKHPARLIVSLIRLNCFLARSRVNDITRNPTKGYGHAGPFESRPRETLVLILSRCRFLFLQPSGAANSRHTSDVVEKTSNSVAREIMLTGTTFKDSKTGINACDNSLNFSPDRIAEKNTVPLNPR